MQDDFLQGPKAVLGTPSSALSAAAAQKALIQSWMVIFMSY